MHLHTVKDSVQCIRDTVVESVISLILESCKHAKSSVGDKLKVVQFHLVIRHSVDSIKNNKLRLAPTRCSLDSQYVHIRCSLPVKTGKNRVSEQAAGVNRGVLWIRITSPIILSLSVKAS